MMSLLILKQNTNEITGFSNVKQQQQQQQIQGAHIYGHLFCNRR